MEFWDIAVCDRIPKAGQLVGCYAATALADNATFLLAVKRIAALTSQYAIIATGSAGRASAP